MRLEIENMTCGGCARSVTKAIQSVDAEARVDIDLAARLVSVTSDAEEAAIVAVLEDVGYPPRRAA